MCNHDWKKINDVRVCKRCGLTVNEITGKVLFDRQLANITKNRRKKK